MKPLLDEYMWGVIHKGIFTLDEAMEKLETDRDNEQNSSFRIVNKEVIITTCDRGNVFYVNSYKDSNPSFSTMIDTYREIHDMKMLAALISDYTEEKLEQFEKASEYSIKQFITNLSKQEKDKVLFELLSSKIN